MTKRIILKFLIICRDESIDVGAYGKISLIAVVVQELPDWEL